MERRSGGRRHRLETVFFPAFDNFRILESAFAADACAASAGWDARRRDGDERSFRSLSDSCQPRTQLR